VQNEHSSAGSFSRYIKYYDRVTCALVLTRAVEEVAKARVRYRKTLMDALIDGHEKVNSRMRYVTGAFEAGLKKGYYIKL